MYFNVLYDPPTLVWPTPLPGSAAAPLLSLGSAIKAPIVIDAFNNLFVQVDSGSIVVVDASTGTARWSIATAANVRASPALGATFAASPYVFASIGVGLRAVGLTSQHDPAWTVPTNVGPTSLWGPSLPFQYSTPALRDPLCALPPAACDGGVLFAVLADHALGEFALLALDAPTGAQLWNATPRGLWGAAPGVAFTSGVALSARGDAAFVGAADGTLVAVRALPGSAQGTGTWTAQLPSSVWSTPAVAPDGTVLVADALRSLWAFNGTSGVERWTFASPGTSAAPPDPGLWPSPAVASGGVVLWAYAYTLTALTLSSGVPRWALPFPALLFSSPSVSYDGATAWQGCSDGSMTALEVASGRVVWTFQGAGAVWGAPAIGRDGRVYFGTDAGNLYALGGFATPAPVPTRSPSATAQPSRAPSVSPPEGSRSRTARRSSSSTRCATASPAISASRTALASVTASVLVTPSRAASGTARPSETVTAEATPSSTSVACASTTESATPSNTPGAWPYWNAAAGLHPWSAASAAVAALAVGTHLLWGGL